MENSTKRSISRPRKTSHNRSIGLRHRHRYTLGFDIRRQRLIKVRFRFRGRSSRKWPLSLIVVCVVLFAAIVPLWRRSLVRNGHVLIMFWFVLRRLVHIWTTCRSVIGANAYNLIVVYWVPVLINVHRVRPVIIVIVISWWRVLVGSVLDRHVLAWSATYWLVEPGFGGNLLNTCIPRVGHFVFWYGTRLRCFLLVNPTTLFLVPSTLRTTHTGTAIFTSRDIHIPVVPRWHPLFVGTISPTMGSSSARWSSLRRMHVATVRAVLIVSRSIRNSRGSSWKWRCRRPDLGDCISCGRHVGGRRRVP